MHSLLMEGTPYPHSYRKKWGMTRIIFQKVREWDGMGHELDTDILMKEYFSNVLWSKLCQSFFICIPLNNSSIKTFPFVSVWIFVNYILTIKYLQLLHNITTSSFIKTLNLIFRRPVKISKNFRV